MNVFDLVASLSLDTREYERGLRSAKATAVGTSSDITKSVANVKKGALIVSGALVAGMTAFGVSSVKAGAEFDTSMSQVAATMGKTTDELEKEVGSVDLAWGTFNGNLREYAQEMGEHTAFSATEAADALNYMALAGYDAQKSMEMLPTVLNLAAAGNMDLATASDMVTDASSALNLSTEETVEMVDKMAMTASKANTSVEQLGDAYLTVGGTANNLSGGTTELSTALGILADSGMKGSEGGTILRNVILSLSAPTKKAQKELDALGVSVFDSEGNMRSMNDIMLDLNESMSDMTSEERAKAMSQIFNKRDLKGVEALLAGAGDRWEELSGYIDDAQGSAQKMADTQLDNLQGDITLLKSAWEGLQINMSNKVTPALRKLVQALTWCIDNAGTLGPIILSVATAFVTFAVAINIGSIIQGVTGAMAALNAVLMANPIAIVIALLAGLTVAFVSLWKKSSAFRAFWIKLWWKIKDVATAAWKGIQNNVINPVKTMYAVVTAVLSKLKEKAVSIWSSIKSIASNTWNGIKNAITHPIETARNTIKGILDKIKGFFPLSIGKIFDNFRLPRIDVHGKFPYGIGGKGEKIDFDIVWNKKAENQPYMFQNATLFGAGERNDELLYGKSALMKDISTAVEGAGGGGQQVYITNYITVDGAENPEEFAERFARKLKLDMRMA